MIKNYRKTKKKFFCSEKYRAAMMVLFLNNTWRVQDLVKLAPSLRHDIFRNKKFFAFSCRFSSFPAKLAWFQKKNFFNGHPNIQARKIVTLQFTGEITRFEVQLQKICHRNRRRVQSARGQADYLDLRQEYSEACRASF